MELHPGFRADGRQGRVSGRFVPGIELTLDGGDVDSTIGSAATNPLSLIEPGVLSPAPCAYSIDLVSALSGDRGDQATIRLVLD